ncbi:MAG TPA: MOSC domain-containing protein [Acidimicrobiia bacterium]|nr:MOSC domain-containing protein [Acidimicrobiia bacterium]
MKGAIHQINISPGGVPKLPIDQAKVTEGGIVGDDHHDKVHHGGPDAALCLYSLEVIEQLQGEGHPIFPGAAGENLTVSGLDWVQVTPGTRWQLGEDVEIEISGYATPCQNNSGWFRGGEILRMHQSRHPGASRVYARVITPGSLRPGDPVTPRSGA